MIVTSCPLRVSLVGGSTDHPKFLEKYGEGSVISFPSSLKSYVSIHQDVFGTNSLDHKYVINYSKRESVHTINEINNELVRSCFEYLNVEEINLFMTSDAFSAGSGLASSSAYILAIVSTIMKMRNKNITEFEICKIAENIEKKFNPLVGQQDFYGSTAGFKKINFYKDKNPSITFLDTRIFDELSCYLIYTGILRNSTKILETINIDKSLPLLDDVKDLEYSINNFDIDLFNHVINRSWKNKKNTSPNICQNDYLINLDEKLKKDNHILSHKLCGAGNGGYFLIFTKNGEEDYITKKYYNSKKIEISKLGIVSTNFKL